MVVHVHLCHHFQLNAKSPGRRLILLKQSTARLKFVERDTVAVELRAGK